MAMQPDLRLAQPFIAGVTGLVTMLLALVLYAGEKGAVSWTPRTILMVAAFLRLLFLFRQPELSDDIYRYLWDGLQTLSWHNPYSLAPTSVPLTSEALASLFGKLNQPTFVTIYPPAAQFVFAAGACLGGGVLGLKVLLTVLDLCTCYLLIRLLAAMNLSPWRAVLYAWHPLAVLEVASAGHIDGAGVFFLTAALLAITAAGGRVHAVDPRREPPAQYHSPGIMASLASGLLFACAALVKLTPLFFLPGFLLLLPRGRKATFCAGFLAGGIILSAPFLPDLFKELDTLAIFAGRWEFSGFIYRSLKKASLSGSMARNILYALFLLLAAVLYGSFRSGRNSPHCPGNKEDRLAASAGNEAIQGEPSAWGLGMVPVTGGETAPLTGYETVEQALPVFLDRQTRCKRCPKNRKPRGTRTGVPRKLPLLLMNTFYKVSMAFLLLTPTLYPWYALPFAALLPFAAGPSGLVLSWSVFLSYQVLIPYTLFGVWAEPPYSAAVIWLAPACAFLLSVLFKRGTKGGAGLSTSGNGPGANLGTGSKKFTSVRAGHSPESN